MPDLVKIVYNGADAFSPQPTPFIGVDNQTIYAGERWGVADAVTLQGQLTGCSFAAIVDAQTTLLSRFNKSFQTLEIWQQTGLVSGLIYQKPFVEVQSVSFPETKMFGVLPYTVNLTCYPSGLFSGVYGVLDPQDTWSFAEQQNATLDATHTISCRGFNTSSADTNALTNARDWAFGRTGTTSMVSPIMISGVSAENFCLLTQVENIDRFNGTYSLVENYTNDLARSGYGVIRYATTVESGNNAITVNLNGSAEGCQRNITGLRAAFNNINKTAIATNTYQSVFDRTDLNPIPLAQSFSEDPFTTRIDFSYTFDNNNQPEVLFDYTVSLSVGTNGFITASIQGTVSARGGDVASKLARTTAYANTINLYNLVLPFYYPFDASSSAPLNYVATTQGKGINQSNGTVDLNATYTNETKQSSVLDRFEYTLDFIPALAQVDAQPKLDGLGQYSVTNLNFARRGSLSINGTAITNRAIAASAGESAVRGACQSLFSQYGSFAYVSLDRNVLTTSRLDDRVLSFDFSWSFGPGVIVGPTTVSSLSV
ncbi:MAG: hypothetical protein WCT07_04770 [Candidatus Paceibacterota bacterium]